MSKKNILILGIHGASQSSSKKESIDSLVNNILTKINNTDSDYIINSKFLKSTFFLFRKHNIKSFFKKNANENTKALICIGKSLGAIKLLEYFNENIKLFLKYFKDKKIIFITIDPHQPGFYDKNSNFIIDFDRYIDFKHLPKFFNYRQINNYPTGALLLFNNSRLLPETILLIDFVLNGEATGLNKTLYNVDHFSIINHPLINNILFQSIEDIIEQ